MRNRSIHDRLMGAFSVFATALLAIIWLVGIAWFFIKERSELRQNLRVHAEMLATQSSAAVVFGDVVALTEDTAALKQMSQVRWVAVLGPRGELIRHGTPPESLAELRAELGRHGNVLETIDSLTVLETVVFRGQRQGEVIVHAELGPTNIQFAAIVAMSLLATAAVLAIAIRIFRRVVDSVSQPLDDLLRLATAVSEEGIPLRRAEVSHRDEVGRLAAAFNRMLDALDERDRSLRRNIAQRTLAEQEMKRSRDELRTLSSGLQSVREEERTRIAHAIHDELGQRLTALKLELARAPDQTGVAVAAEMIDATIQAARTLSWELRPSLLDTLGLAAAIEWLGQDFQRRMGIRCKLAVPDETGPIADELATDLFRIAQELLTNVTRHARASRVEIRFVEGDEILLEVKDNGVGMMTKSPETASLGLLGIRERVERWGGRLEIATVPTIRGTRVRVVVPQHALANAPIPENSA